VHTDIEELTTSEINSEQGLESHPLVNALLLQPLSVAQIQQLSPSALAYLGDAVYELYIRRSYLLPAKRIQTYHHQVVAQVRAEAQSHHLQKLSAQLTQDELEIVRRGRNAATGRPKRIDPETYQHATGLETLVGYLYLTDPRRLLNLLTQLELHSPAQS
jgi:ribonuclease-3 family protein